MKREDKTLEDFLARMGIDLKGKPPVPKVDFSTLTLKTGDTLLEVASGCVAKVVEIDRDRGIGFSILNRPHPEILLYDTQKDVEQRIAKGCLIMTTDDGTSEDDGNAKIL
ncbi:MAG: hypothetical protein LBF89_11165 [Bacteroidales bacterium]|jgi:hypothetical protein|nr:hypothetical protein [Bacteroidales bacterium]